MQMKREERRNFVEMFMNMDDIDIRNRFFFIDVKIELDERIGITKEKEKKRLIAMTLRISVQFSFLLDKSKQFMFSLYKCNDYNNDNRSR